ncbi:MAG: SSU ribosomal protein S9p (S16e), partial [uncultured Acetobacteraceae bacterium]
ERDRAATGIHGHARRPPQPGAGHGARRRGGRRRGGAGSGAEARRVRAVLRHRPAQGRGGAGVGEARQGRHGDQRQAVGAVLRPPGAADADQPALPGGRPLPAVRRVRHRGGRRPVRPGGRPAARHQPRADQLRAGIAADPEEGRVPDARPARGGAQEVRPRQGPTFLPVQQAL